VSQSNNTKFIQLWRLGDTSVRNPYRITGALKIFKVFFDGKKNFTGGDSEQQYNFMKKLLTFTEDGKEIEDSSTNEVPITVYGELSKAQKQEKARYWCGLMENMGMINVFKNDTIRYASDKNNASITKVGQLFLNHPELRNEIWLRQVLKRQFPNHKSPHLQYLKIRGGWWLIKLILDLDGLERWEMSLASTTKQENLDFMKKVILKYRKDRHSKEYHNQLKKLKEKMEITVLEKWFEEDYQLRKNTLFKIIKSIEKCKTIDENEINEELKQSITTHNGPNTPLAKSTRQKIIKLLSKKDFEEKNHQEVLHNWYFSMKRRTVFSDYKDSNSRILERTGFVTKVSKSTDEDESETYYRLRVLDEHKKFITDALNNTLPIKEIGTEEENENNYKYLTDPHQPLLKTDDIKYLKEQIKEMKIKLEEHDFSKKDIEELIKLENIDKNNLILSQKIIFYKLHNKIKKVTEEKFIANMNKGEIENKISELLIPKKDLKTKIRSKPIQLEETIWYAIGRLGGFVKHVSETRNFHVDSKFRAVFTAAGVKGVGDESLPDMQFHYSCFDEVVEVTTSSGKTQWRMEGDPVPQHVAEHQFYHGKQTNGLFIAPTLHTETIEEFWRYSKPDVTYMVKKNKEKIHLIPLTIDEFHTIWKKCILSKNPSKHWIEILTKLHKILDNDPKKWLEKIKQCVKDFENG
jgi:hypothetical protein